MYTLSMENNGPTTIHHLNYGQRTTPLPRGSSFKVVDRKDPNLTVMNRPCGGFSPNLRRI